MKRILIAAIMFLGFLGCAYASVPDLVGRVNDYANILTPNEKDSLTKQIYDLEKNPSKPQMAILLITTLNGQDVESYANDVFKAWKLGQAGKDNGVLLVISIGDRKIRFEIGYGLEESIPDTATKHIANDMIPYLKKGKEQWANALAVAINEVGAKIPVDSLVQTNQTGPAPIASPVTKPVAQTSSSGSFWGSFFLLIILLGAGWFIIYKISRGNKTKASGAFRPDGHVPNPTANDPVYIGPDPIVRPVAPTPIVRQTYHDQYNDGPNYRVVGTPKYRRSTASRVVEDAGSAVVGAVVGAEIQRELDRAEDRRNREQERAEREAERRRRDREDEEERAARRRRDDDDNASSSSSLWSSSSSSSSSNDSGWSSSSGSDSSSFSGGGGDSGGGGSTSDF